ncbi:MAG: hypothetical protein B6U86_04560 [Candidatus Altiarchaeales archaeon ex4484_43]|nr:MAG: hypothetical protein B6U86_04560 [Candidatus Altiarchaeales archaeon ex4484_43]
MECPSCGAKIRNGDMKCPSCGFNLELKDVIGTLKRADYLIERERGGRFLYSNFNAMRAMSVMAFKKMKPIRPILGDRVHVTFPVLRFLSMASLYPQFAYDFYRLGKLLGYYGVEGLPTGVFRRLSSILKGSETEMLKSRIFQNMLINGWKRVGGGILEFIDFDESERRLRYRLLKSAIFPPGKRLSHPACFIQMGALCGIIEAVSGRFCEGIETKCAGMGDPYCEFELYLRDEMEHPRFELISKDQFKMSLDFIINELIEETKGIRKGAGDYIHISIDQGINYMILSLSRGHVVLSKWSGRLVGERMVELKGIGNIFDALDYLGNLFQNLKIGIMEKELLPDVIGVKIEESVYSSGVKNINMKLCTFIAGILEGALHRSSREDWVIKETKCIANGDEYCEFECRTSDPDTLKKMLLG